MKKYWVLFIFFGLIVRISGQEIVLDINVDKQYQNVKGPNMKHFIHFYAGSGLIMPFDEHSGAKINFSKSWDLIFGFRYKRKLLPFYAIGLDANLRYRKFGIQNEKLSYSAAYPLTMASKVDRFAIGIGSSGLEVYNRINIGSRGNILGNFLDIGLRGEWNFGTKEIINDRLENQESAENIRTVRKNLKYIQNFSSVATIRIGFNKLIIFGNYQLTDLFKKQYNFVELPALSIGLQYNFINF